MLVLHSRVFTNGNSQAVRIPQEFKLNTSRIEISRNEDGDLVIHPLPEKRGQQLLDTLSAFDHEFADILEKDYDERLLPQERDEL